MSVVVHVFANAVSDKKVPEGHELASSVDEALDVVRNGGELILHEGTYPILPIVIQAEHKLVLCSAPGDKVNLKPSADNDGPAFFDIESSHVHIRNLTFLFPNTEGGIRSNGCENLVLNSCILRGGGLRLINCEFDIVDNKFVECSGILCIEGAGTVSGNTLTQCSENALTIDRAMEVTIESNVFERCRSHAICAIEAVKLQITENLINCERTGIFFNASAASKISKNVIYNCAGHGICICDVDGDGHEQQLFHNEYQNSHASKQMDGAAGSSDSTNDNTTFIMSNYVCNAIGNGIDISSMPRAISMPVRHGDLIVMDNYLFDCDGVGVCLSGPDVSGLYSHNTICGNKHALGNVAVCGLRRNSGRIDVVDFLGSGSQRHENVPTFEDNKIVGQTQTEVYESVQKILASWHKPGLLSNRKAPTDPMSKSTHGVSIFLNGCATMRKNRISNHRCDGIRLYSAATSTEVHNNDISLNDECGIHYVLHIASLLVKFEGPVGGSKEIVPGQLTVYENKVCSNGLHGIRLTLTIRDDQNHHFIQSSTPRSQDSSQPHKAVIAKFHSNDVFDNNKTGVFLDIDADTLTHDIHGPHADGIILFEGNKIHRNATAGVYVKGTVVGLDSKDVESLPPGPRPTSESTVAGDAEVEDTSEVADDAKSTSELCFSIDANDVHSSNGYGIVTRQCGRDCVVRRNNVHHNATAGILLLEASGCSVEDNEIHQNGEYGILCDGKLTARITRNDIKENAGGGIGVCHGAAPEISHNDIHENSNGINVFEQGEGDIVDNKIKHNSGIGITVSTGGNPTIRGNDLIDCEGGAIVAYRRAAGRVLKNKFELTGEPPQQSWYFYGQSRPPSWVVVCDAIPAGTKPKAASRYSSTDVQYNSGSAPMILSSINMKDFYSSSDEDDDGDAFEDDDDDDEASVSTAATSTSRKTRHVVHKYLSSTQ